MDNRKKNMELLGDILGNVGVVCFLLAYFLLQKEVVAHNQMIYLLLNLVGSLLMIFSLCISWNLPAFILESCWALISVYGIFKATQNKNL